MLAERIHCRLAGAWARFLCRLDRGRQGRRRGAIGLARDQARLGEVMDAAEGFAVEHRHDADFPQKMQRLLVDRESLWTPEYRAAYAQTEAAARSLIVDLMAESTVQQRQKLKQKIDGVRSDFKALS